MDKLYLSKQKMDDLKRLMPDKSVYFHGIHVQSSPMFPFEITYDACDIESKMEVKIPSGEWVHGVIIPEMPPIDIEPISWEFSPEINELHKYNRSLQSFLFSLYK